MSVTYKEECLKMKYFKYQQITYTYTDVPAMYKNLKLLKVQMFYACIFQDSVRFRFNCAVVEWLNNEEQAFGSTSTAWT